ncbi:MAG: hypothetical protein ACRDHL_01635 [Candidatus Promineifilaceae bacterium]
MRISPPTIVAVVAGLLTLLGLLFFRGLADLLLGWAAFVAAAALLLGIINLALVHGRRVLAGNRDSAILLGSMALVFLLALADGLGLTREALDGAFRLVIAPLESAVVASLAFFLLFAAFRLLQRRPGRWAWLFLAAALLTLLGQPGLPAGAGQLFAPISQLLADLVVEPGTRGILLGVALGVIAVALRLLTGLERPYDK